MAALVSAGFVIPSPGYAQQRAGGDLTAQSGTADTRFEVASVKRADISRLGRGRPTSYSGGRFSAELMSLSSLAMEAYGIREAHEIEWKFPWMASELYDVNAKGPAGATKAQIQVMLQQLLLDRFGLAVHHESRQLAGFRLVVGKNGAKLKRSAATPASSGAGASPNDIVMKGGKPQFSESAGSGALVTLAWQILRGRHESISGLVSQLAKVLRSPVVDATGLDGVFDYDLSFAPQVTPLPKGSLVLVPPGAAAQPARPQTEATLDEYPLLADAIKEQLGLQLEAVKAIPVDVLVLDSANRVPTAD
jgi:uncharacterized protein (TIGR03435 family)